MSSDEDNGGGYIYEDEGGMDNYIEEEEMEEIGFEQRMEGQNDIFTFKNVELPGIPKSERIRKFAVAEETRVLLTESNKLYRWRIRNQPEFKCYQLPEMGRENFLGLLAGKDRTVSVKNIYLDAKGYHCIISGEGGNNYYLNFREKKIRNLKELKGVNIKTLCFHSSGSETKSGDILLHSEGILVMYKVGCSQGEVEETVATQLSLPSEINSIQILRLEQENGQYVVVLLSTISSIFYLTGPDDLHLLLNGYRNQPQKIKERSMPRGYQCLIHTCYSRITKRPTFILWTNGKVLIKIKMPQKNEVVNDSFFNRNQTVKFAKKVNLPDQKAYQVQEAPLGIGITDFHYYLLFQESITIISSITQKIVLNEEFKATFASDMVCQRNTSIFWIYNSSGVIKLDTTQEGSQAWKLLLAEKKYQEAYNVCKAKNQNVSYVAGLYADSLFQKRNYKKAAIYFSETSRSFEEITLKFLQADANDARDGLQLYLKSWQTKLQPEDKAQRCLLVSFMIELMVYSLNSMEQERDSFDERRNAQLKKKLQEKKQELYSMIQKNLDVLNQDLVYLIMQSHGRIQNLIDFAEKKSNYEMIIMHYLSEENYQKALDCLRNVKDTKIVDVIYKYSHIFFRYEPEKTAALLIHTIKDFKPIKLMPGLMNIPEDKRVYGIDLLRYCVEEQRSWQKSLHNILIFFYVTAPKDKIPELIQLMKKGYLNFQLDFGLRLFKNHKVIEAQIIVCGKMYLYAQAVSLALEHNKEDLAKEYADKPDYQDQRKKLWIQIAKHYLVKKGKISEVIELTKQSKVVKIEDLLPYFNQNIKIQNFKDQICDSLKSYSEQIARLKNLMDSYSTNSQQLKNELRTVKNRCIEIDSSQKCEECLKALFSRQFYIFPCMHGFHRDCLFETIRTQPTTNRLKVEKISVLHEEIKAIQEKIKGKKMEKRQGRDAGSGTFSFMNALSIWNTKREEDGNQVISEKEYRELKVKKTQIDSVLATECIYCGPSVVETITMPFDNEEMRNSWKI